jgi:hypothetical protein
LGTRGFLAFFLIRDIRAIRGSLFLGLGGRRSAPSLPAVAKKISQGAGIIDPGYN